MLTPKRQLMLTLLKACDICIMLLALAISLGLSSRGEPGHSFALWDVLQIKLKLVNVVLLLIFIPTWHLIFLTKRLYTSRRLEQGKGEWKAIVSSVLIGTSILLVAAVVFRRTHIDTEMLVVFAALAAVLTVISRVLMRTILGRLRRSSRNLRHLLLVGSNHRIHHFVRHVMANPQLGYRIVGYIDDPPSEGSYEALSLGLTQLGTLQDLDEVIDREHIDEVVIALPIRSFYEHIKRIIAACELQGIQTHLMSDFFQLAIARAHATEVDGIPLLTLTPCGISAWPASVKRAFDVIVASLLVLVHAPVLVLVALLIKLHSPKDPVFFVQTRVGRNRRHFRMIKFRTMVPDAERLQQNLECSNEAHGPVFKITNDPRITPIGRFLRKTSLDELPQLFNVLRGDMSLVGPRPLPLRDVARFEEAWLKRRFSVKPGMTCLWQVSGRSHTTFDTWMKQDLEYIDNWSFGLDLKILLKTIPAVAKGVGAH